MNNSSTHKRAGVALTFDDRYIHEWFEARKIFGPYDAKATFFISEFDKLTDQELDMLRTLKQEGHEIACHGLRHLHAVKFCEQHSIQEYIDTEILPAIRMMTEKGFTPQTFSYPYGAHIPLKRILHHKHLFALASEIDSELLKYFRVLRRVDFGTIRARQRRRFVLVGPRPKYYYLGEDEQKICVATGIDAKYGHTEHDIVRGLQWALEYDCAIVFYGHRISRDTGKYTTHPDLINTICHFVKANNMRYYCIDEL